MDFRILGPLEAHDENGAPIALTGRQQRIVLGLLLLHPNEVVSVDQLIDALWPEGAPASAVKTVQILVSRVRKALEPSEAARAILQTRGAGYLLEVAPGELDADRFERLLEQGREALATGEPKRARSTLAEALALWRVRPLADLAYEEFAQSEIGRLEDLRLAALEERIDADLALGREGLVPELRALVAENPLRERLLGQLMVALDRSGRRPEALRAYDEFRRALAEELGLEPSPTLRELHGAMLAEDAAQSHGELPSGPPERRKAPRITGRSKALFSLGGALLVLAALAVAALTLTRTSAGIVAVEPNTVAGIDPDTNRVVTQIPVGARPASVVSGEGALWVANLDDDLVSRVDTNEGRVDRYISTGTDPSALAAGDGAVWTIGPDGVVVRIDPAFNGGEVTDRIHTVDVGTLLGTFGMSGGLAATSDAVWAISGGDRSTPQLFRVNPAKKQKRARSVAVTSIRPTAIASGFGDLWVTDSFENTVSRIDPTGLVIHAIPVGRGANAVAVGDDAIWVVSSLDGEVARIDPETDAVKRTIHVGRNPTAVAVGAGAVWVANRGEGTISRIDPKTNSVVKTIELGSRPAGLAFADGKLWVTNQAGNRQSGVQADGSLRISVSEGLPPTDPALWSDLQLSYATCAKLLNYPDRPGRVGTRVVPEVAASLPSRSADGRTYTFTIRDGFAFSPPLEEAVTAQTFKYSIERSLHPKMRLGSSFVSDIVGQAAYASGKSPHISGLVVHGDKLSITLLKPAPDFLARIAMPLFCAVPLNTPIDPEGVRAIPSAGPYFVAEEVPGERTVLRRNPNYRGSRPRRVREVRYTIGSASARNLDDVRAGRSDYVWELPPDRDLEAKLVARYGPGSADARDGRQRYFINPNLSLGYLALNTSRPLFSNARMRRAVNYAINRRALAAHGHLRLGGDFPVIPTDQYLPPNMPGASHAPLYPPGGDIRAARRLAPNAHGTAVLYTCDFTYCRQQARIIKSNLKALGLNVDVREFQFHELFEKAARPGEPYDILAGNWLADYADPADFLNVLLPQDGGPNGGLNQSHFVDKDFARKLDRLAGLSGEARYRGYAALSVELARGAAPWVAYATGNSRDFFAERIGCQVYQPVYGMDLGALCIRSS